MLSALTGATQVKLETSDDTFLESLASPLLSPLEIKTEKGYYQQSQNNHQNNNNTIHLHSNHLSHNNNNSYSVQSHYHNNPQVPPNHLNGYQDFNIHHGQVPHQQYSNNYYNWQQNGHQPNQQAAPVYGNKYATQSNLCAPISRLMYVPPLTPPSSDPGSSPGNSIQVSNTLCRTTNVKICDEDKLISFVLSQGPLRRTPPPPYHIQQQQHHMQNITIHPTSNANNQSSPQLSSSSHHHHQPLNQTHTILNNGNSNDNNNNNLSHCKSENTNNNSNNNNKSNKIIIKKTSTTTITTNHHSSIILTSSGVKTIVGKYNRRNNPELEKRRIHHCDFIGKLQLDGHDSLQILCREHN